MYVSAISMRLFLGSSIPATRAIERSSRYPWRCLWRGLEHRIRTTPSRRTTLQFLQIFLTDALTFILFSLFSRDARPGGSGHINFLAAPFLAHPVRYSAAGQVVRGQFHCDLVAGQDFY